MVVDAVVVIVDVYVAVARAVAEAAHLLVVPFWCPRVVETTMQNENYVTTDNGLLLICPGFLKIIISDFNLGL